MSDITERLTELSELMIEGRPLNDGDFTDIDEAIMEIERLRKKVAYLTEQADRWEDDALRLMKERNEAMDEVSLLRSTVTDLNIEIERLRKENGK